MDLSEWAFLAAKGLMVALVPLSIVWSTRGADALRRLAWVTVFFTFDLVVFGGFTRLTDSGLGCPDWPGCFAQSSPLSASRAIESAALLAPGGPVTMTKAWIEMIHRFLAIAVGVLIALMMGLSWMQRRRAGRSFGLASAAFALVCLQGAFGALTVTQKLQPVIVTTHLLLGLSLLALLMLHALRFDRSIEPGSTLPILAPGVRGLAVVGMVALVCQVALGGWVSTNYAVLACPDFPLCRGQWIPDMDLSAGFELWRQLGQSTDFGFISPEALVAIHWVHRTFALVVTAILLPLGLVLWHRARMREAGLLVGLLGLQLATGIGNVLLRWPLLVAVLHNAGAAGLVLTLVMVNYRLARRDFHRRTPVETAPLAAT